MPRLKKKWTQQPAVPVPTPMPAPVPLDTPAHPNVVQAARYFGLPDPETRGAQAFRRWAHRVGAKTVLLGKRYTYDLKQLEELWQKAAR